MYTVFNQIPDELSTVIFMNFLLLVVVRYNFQTPEAWTTTDRYRALCYMRPLAIWAMQWALSEKISIIEELKELDNEAILRHHAKFSKVARLLKLPEDGTSASVIQTVYDYTLKRFF